MYDVNTKNPLHPLHERWTPVHGQWHLSLIAYAWPKLLERDFARHKADEADYFRRCMDDWFIARRSTILEEMRRSGDRDLRICLAGDCWGWSYGSGLNIVGLHWQALRSRHVQKGRFR